MPSITDHQKFRVLMACMGNICRSPTAHAVLRHKLEAAGLGDWVIVDSAGTHSWHRGKPPDPRAIQHAQRRGYDLSTLRAKGVAEVVISDFDLILAMDQENLAALQKNCPPEQLAKLSLLSRHAVHMVAATEIPDPYYGGPNGFEHVLDLVEDACDGLVAHIRQELRLRAR